MKKRKCEEFLSILLYVESGKSNVFTYDNLIIDPSGFSVLLFNKQETLNVWGDVKKLVEVNFTGNKKNRLLKLVNTRVAFLKGDFIDEEAIELKAKYITNMKHYKKFFSDEAIKYGLERICLKDFSDTEDVYSEYFINLYKEKGYKELRKCCREVVKKDEYTRRNYIVVEKGITFLVPNRYQTKEKDFLKLCMLYDYPYMKKYFEMKNVGVVVNLYHLDNDFEFYIDLGKERGVDSYKNSASIYMPFECLKTKSIKPAIDRMNEYFRDYYGKLCGKPKDLEFHLNVMKTELFKSLTRDIENGK